MNFRTQLRIMIQLSLVDNQLSPSEKRMIYTLGKANNIPKGEIDSLFESVLIKKQHTLPSIKDLTEEDKLEYLCNLIQLMKIDKKVYLSEIRFCELLAEKLGYKRNVVSALSTRIFADPAFNPDRRTLSSILEKYKQ